MTKLRDMRHEIKVVDFSNFIVRVSLLVEDLLLFSDCNRIPPLCLVKSRGAPLIYLKEENIFLIIPVYRFLTDQVK